MLNFKQPHIGINSNIYTSELMAVEFNSRHTNTIYERESFVLADSLFDMVQKAKNYLEQQGIEDLVFFSFEEHEIMLQGDGIHIQFNREGGRVTQAFCGIAAIKILGYPKLVESILDLFDRDYEICRQAQLELWYHTKDGPDFVNILLNSHGEDRPEFYPWLPSNFLDNYMASTASILFLMGEPGTGKTSVLRNMICNRSLNAVATYDEKVLNNDQMFLNFITSSKKNILIIEDADDVLVSRSRGKNDLISRFLNFSDGLAKVPDKKIVFTTNLNNFNNVDPALTRSGRCYDVLEARKLTYDEAMIAATVAKVPLPKNEKQEYTISDLINQGDNKLAHHQVGFHR